MRVKLNGAMREVPDGLSVSGLLQHLGVKPHRVAVAVNEAVVTKAERDARALQAGDEVDIVALIPGA